MATQKRNLKNGDDALFGLSTGAMAIALGAVVGLGSTAVGTNVFAAPPLLGPLTQVSGPSPFFGCTADDVSGQEAEGSISYPDAEIEPFSDVNPTNNGNVLVGFQQDRWSDGGARGLVAGFSDDGGQTWNEVAIPGVTLCSNGVFERASDPWVSFAPNGDAYFMSLAFDFNPAIFGGHSAMLVNKSVDDGHSWGAPITLIEDNDPNVLNDKNAITADPISSNRVYAVWDRLELFHASVADRQALGEGGPDLVLMAKRLSQMLANRVRTAAAPEFKGPTYFTRTTNGGKSWGLAHIIYDPGADNQTINNQIVVQPSGRLIAFFTEILNFPNGTFAINLALKHSTDHGFSFEPVSRPVRAQQIFSNGTLTPDLQEPVRDASILFDTAVDPNHGTLYAVWQDIRFNGVEQIAFSQSTNNGLSWSAPIKINKTPKRSNILREQAFVPTIAVSSNGVVAATYYDFRMDDNTGERADHWIVFCDPSEGSCTAPANWRRERRLTTASFDILDAPIARGHFLGDYMGQAAAGMDLLPVFGLPDGVNETSIFTRRVSPATAVSSAAE
jgi:hypothetical protein